MLDPTANPTLHQPSDGQKTVITREDFVVCCDTFDRRSRVEGQRKDPVFVFQRTILVEYGISSVG